MCFNMTKSDRRKHPRVKTRNQVSYVCIDDKENELAEGIGRTLDISQSGVLLETNDIVDSEYILIMTISLDSEILEIKGKVVYSRIKDSGKFLTGIHFMESRTKKLEIIKAFIRVYSYEKAKNTGVNH